MHTLRCRQSTKYKMYFYHLHPSPTRAYELLDVTFTSPWCWGSVSSSPCTDLSHVAERQNNVQTFTNIFCLLTQSYDIASSLGSISSIFLDSYQVMNMDIIDIDMGDGIRNIQLESPSSSCPRPPLNCGDLVFGLHLWLLLISSDLDILFPSL